MNVCALMPLDQLLIDLKLVSKVSPGERLCVSSRLLAIDHNTGWWQSVWRRWTGESRHETFEHLQTLFFHATTLAHNLLGQPDQESKRIQVRLICDAMQAALPGLHNLQQTYSDDPRMVASMEVMAQNIELNIRDIQAKL